MNTFYVLLAVLVAIAQRSASFPYGGYYGEYPGFGYSDLGYGYPYAPFAYGAYGFPYGLYSHHYHPRAALRNVAKAFHRENGHLSDTTFISPIKSKSAHKQH
ncbi:hypothetical protein Y032_0477g2169 [Ancylostoma ceylanicum]|uniref:Sulfur globule protein CV3 domain protein n=1 Tax=Ancylostoma ceylanicum TaxID=53326 RepID=A0A016WWB3_9BILA|nr:hypothetical protein Y032_0477g2169 [Ancylostoma ceylanicum]